LSLQRCNYLGRRLHQLDQHVLTSDWKFIVRLQGARFAEFQDFFDLSQGESVVVVHSLALLELAREGLVDITQADAYAPIYVRLAFSPTTAS
jgi:chromatin segregation and condensation protein Rec8/ScpA/Scc1 (kleisin family)